MPIDPLTKHETKAVSRQNLPGRRRLTADFPIEDKQHLEDWAHRSDTSTTALLVAMNRIVLRNPELRAEVEQAATEYTRAMRARR